MVFTWLPKLFLGSALLAGTGVGLGITIFSSSESNGTELTSIKESQPEEIEFENETSKSKEGLDTKQEEDNSLSTEHESLESVKETKEEGTVDAQTEDIKIVDESEPSGESPIEQTGCRIHQLDSSSGGNWKFSEIGDWEKFLKEKIKEKPAINKKKIKKACDSAKGKDILVANKTKGWWSWGKWDYFEEDQKNSKFLDYLKNRG